jgi:hypothetical protein
MNSDQALVRAGHIANVKGIKLNGGELTELAGQLKADPEGNDRLMVRAADICRIKNVSLTGTELLKMMKFLRQDKPEETRPGK